MSILSKMGNALKDASKNLSDEMKQNQERRKAKGAILERMDMAQLKRLCVDYGIGEPSKFDEDPWTGDKTKRTVTRDHFVDRAMERLKFVQIVAFCEKHRIRVADLLPKEGATPTPSSPSPAATHSHATATPPTATKPAERAAPAAEPSMETILDAISAGFEPEETRDEKEFEKLLTTWLKVHYPGQVTRQVQTPQGKIDLVLFGRFAIELKIAENPQRLRDLIGQVHSYKKAFPDVAVILLDVGLLRRDVIAEFLDDYRKMGARAVTIDGTLKRVKKKGGTTIHIS